MIHIEYLRTRSLSTLNLRDRVGQLYRKTVSRSTNVHTIEVAQVLKAVPLFAGFGWRELIKFADVLHIRQYQKDEYLYRERDPGLGMYIVQSGRIRLVVEDEEGGLHEVKQVSECELLGESALLGEYRRMESAQAVTETVVLGFFRPELKSMIKRDPKTASLLLFALGEHISEHFVQLSSFLMEKDGKMSARRMIDTSKSRVVGFQDSSSSFIVRS